MKISIPTNHNYFEESPLSETQLMARFNLRNKKELKQLNLDLFSSVFSLTTKHKLLEQVQIFGFKNNRNKLDEEEQLLLKLYAKDCIEGNRQYIIQTGLFAGVLYHKGHQVNITSKYGDVFLRRMLNSVNDIYINNQKTNAVKSNETNEFQNIIAYLFIQSLEKASFLGLPKVYQNNSQHRCKVRGKIDVNAYLKKSIPFSGKLTSTLREQVYVQEVIDVLYFACSILERNFGKEIHRKIMGTLQILKQNYSGNYPNHQVIGKAKGHASLQNPVFSSFKRVIEYAEIIIKELDLQSSNTINSLKTQGYLFDISQLFEVYLEKLLSRHFVDWYVTGQEELTVYPNQFFKRKMFPDLVLKHKETGKVMVFDAKFKTMKLRKNDLDREDFYQIHSYIQYYLPNVVLGGLIYPLSKDNDVNSSYANSLFESDQNDTGFIVDGIFVKEGMSEQEIITNEQSFLKRVEAAIS